MRRAEMTAPGRFGAIVLPTETLRIVSRDQSGRPRRARIACESLTDGWNKPKVNACFETDARGEAAVGFLFAGRYRIEARFEDGPRVRCSTTVPRAEPLQLGAKLSCQVTVHVVDEDGVGVPFAEFDYGVWPQSSRPPLTTWPRELWDQGRADIEGAAELPGVLAGTLWVRANWLAGTEQMAEKRVRITPGKRHDVVVAFGR